ncbi:MAG: ketoacyl-ACP synthase III [Acidobacteria bacterium]|nr:ketoacyl-ACP synthase III [Acidobacteriota bacterium]
MPSILGFGACLPPRVVTHEELAERLGVEPGWILEACGIRERRWAQEETVVDLAEGAAREALSAGGLRPGDLGAIILGTGTPQRQFPGVSAELQRRLGCPGIPAFDVHLASSGGMVALCLARELCRAYGPVLAVGAERMSDIVQRDFVKETAILFGDGAGAAVVSPAEGPLEILEALWAADGDFASDLCLDSGGPLKMNGRTVIMQANRKLVATVETLLARAGRRTGEVDLFVFHQANLNLLRQVARTLGVEASKVPITLHRYGNTSAASVLIAAAEAWKEGRFHFGSLGLLAAFGAGFSWGGMLVEAR